MSKSESDLLLVSAREVAECLVAEIHDDDVRRLCERAMSSFGSTLEVKLRAFHRLYGLPILRPDQASRDFSHITKERLAARFGLIIEGFEALCEAMGFEANLTFEAQNHKGEIIGGLSAFDAIQMTDDRALPEIAGAAEDLKVYLTGFQLENGIPVEEVSTEVMCSNLTRLDDEGDPIYRADGKVLKGPNYVPPNCERILRAHGLPSTVEAPLPISYPTPEIRSAEELEDVVEANVPHEDEGTSTSSGAESSTSLATGPTSVGSSTKGDQNDPRATTPR